MKMAVSVKTELEEDAVYQTDVCLSVVLNEITKTNLLPGL